MKFAVIGLGSFGLNVAKTLYEKKNEVLAIDIDKERVEEVKSFVSHAVCMNSADKESLEALGVQEMDVAIVSLGPAMEASILTVLYLQELGVKGATEVIYPEKDMAIRTALRLSNPNILEYLPLISGYSIQELAPPDNFIGKTLRELDLRNKYGIQVLAIKELIPEKITFIPSADFMIKDSDILVILGEEKQLAKLNSQAKP